MTSWYSKFLGDAIVAQTELTRIETIFANEYEKKGKPSEMAIFIRYNAEGGLHCKVTAFFSPETEDVAQGVDASPCPRPLPHQMELFAGKEESWSMLFPEERD